MRDKSNFVLSLGRFNNSSKLCAIGTMGMFTVKRLLLGNQVNKGIKTNRKA